MVPRWSLVLGVKSAPWDQRGPTPLSWARSQAWSGDHDDMGPPVVPVPLHDGPARSDGAHGTGRSRGRATGAGRQTTHLSLRGVAPARPPARVTKRGVCGVTAPRRASPRRWPQLP